MTVPRPFRWLVAATCLTLAAAPAHLHAQAQATTGVIRGIVSDSSGAPLANATVRLRNLETNAERTLTTNERGVYVATLLRVGTYDVAARALVAQQGREHPHEGHRGGDLAVAGARELGLEG